MSSKEKDTNWMDKKVTWIINSRLNVVMGMNFELEDRSEKTI